MTLSPSPILRALLPAAALTLAAAAPARADAVPDLDVEKTCQASKAANTSVSDRASYEGCLRSENQARKEAERRWGDFTPRAKAQCQAQFEAGGYPSYVEMITCLELASGTVPTQTDAGDTAVGGPGAPGGGKPPKETGTGLTKEPPASQRTNPIEVLENK